MAAMLKVRAVSLAGLLLALAPVRVDAAVARPVEAGAAVGDDMVLTALAKADHGDLRPLEALLAKGGMEAAAQHVLEARRASAYLRFDEARAALGRYFAGQDQDKNRLFAAHDVAWGVALLSGRYAEAARHAEAQLAMSAGKPQDKIDGIRRVLEMGTQWADVPAQAIEAPGNGEPVLLARDKVGLLRSPVRVNGVEQNAVLDTGASISVASESAAKRLGLRMMDGTSSIGNSIGGGVDIRLAVADRLELGGVVARNVVFVVMDDAALDFPVPGGYRIDTIVGLPVLQAVGRIEFNLVGKTLRITPAPTASAEPANLRVIGTSPYVMTNIAGVEVPLYFDTGANSTALYPQFAARKPDLRPIADERKIGKAGAGGVKHVQNMFFQNLAVGIGRQSAIIGSIGYRPDGPEDREVPFGVLGIDVLSRFRTFAIDYKNMVLEVGHPLAEDDVSVAGQ